MTLMNRSLQRTFGWDPFRELENLQNEMSRLFDFSLARRGDKTSVLETVWSPAIDIVDEKDNLIVKADMPGLNKDEIQVSVEGDTLTIKGEKKEEKETNDKNFIRGERFYRSFYRAVSLPSTVDSEKVKATYKNGVLELALPKKEEAKLKQISIEVK